MLSHIGRPCFRQSACSSSSTGVDVRAFFDIDMETGQLSSTRAGILLERGRQMYRFRSRANVIQSFEASVCGRRRRSLTDLKSIEFQLKGGHDNIASLKHLDSFLSWKPHFRHPNCPKNPLRGPQDFCSPTARLRLARFPWCRSGIGSLFLIPHQSSTPFHVLSHCPTPHRTRWTARSSTRSCPKPRCRSCSTLPRRSCRPPATRSRATAIQYTRH